MDSVIIPCSQPIVAKLWSSNQKHHYHLNLAKTFEYSSARYTESETLGMRPAICSDAGARASGPVQDAVHITMLRYHGWSVTEVQLEWGSYTIKVELKLKWSRKEVEWW